MRVVVISILICALSFVAGVAGDLSLAAQPTLAMASSARATIPADAIRAHPLPPLRAATRARVAAPARTIEVAAVVAPLIEKPGVWLMSEPALKVDPLLSAKAGKDALG